MVDRPASSIGSIPARPPSAADEPPARLTVAPAGRDDAPQLVEVLAAAFLNDPTWSWALPDPARRKRMWQVYIDGGLRYPWVFKTSGFEAVSLWIPPGGTELAPEVEAQLPALLAELAGSRVPEVAELLHRFEDAHPRGEPHYYLSLLATQPAQRGRGLGMALLRENLARIDVEHRPAYLESTNPVNDHRYASVGFAPVVSFTAPGDGPHITGMWRKSH